MTNQKAFYPVNQCNDGMINTASGKVVDLKNPTADMLDIKDIANSLSKICRFGGHVTHFYSVAQHSVLVSYLMQEGEGKYGFEALMHDASEAYLGDVIKPLKVILGNGYKHLEYGFSNAIAAKYGLSQSPDIDKLIHKYDREALELEHEAFQKGNHVPMIAALERLGLYTNHTNWDANEARILFLLHFSHCKDNSLSLIKLDHLKDETEHGKDNRISTACKEGLLSDKWIAN